MLQTLAWSRYKQMNAIPIAEVPKRIRKALPHPNNMVEDGEWVYTLTYRYIWRELFWDLQKRYGRFGRKENPLRAPSIPCFR